MDLAANIGKPSLVHDIEKHLKDGALPADYRLPAQPASAPQDTDGQTLRRACCGIVRAVHRPAWLRLRFNAASNGWHAVFRQRPDFPRCGMPFRHAENGLMPLPRAIL